MTTQPAAATPVIALSQVTRIYGEGDGQVRALRGIDLTIMPGEFVAVMGPSGSGKSTCMNILGCLDTPTSGTYRFLGVTVGGMSPDQRALLRRNYLGFGFQGFNLLSLSTALFFIPNDRKKYSVGENGGMKLNDKGGIEVYVAAAKPEGVPEENWLPINRKDENMDIVMRIYVPDLEKFKTWKAPEAEKLGKK